MSEPESRRLYLPELDGLRFLAFFLVFLFHQGIPSSVLAPWVGRTVARAFRENGWVGVQLFFLLSGYLITTLLLREEAAFGRVDLKAFWVRRVLRIWPLYDLTVLIVFVLIPLWEGNLLAGGMQSDFARHLPWFLAFLGNWSMALRTPVGGDAKSILWSVCVEEQFYLVVPLVVAWVRAKWRPFVVVGLMAGSVAFRAWLAYTDANQTMLQWNTFAQFDTLLSGVLLALFLGREPRSARAGRWLRWAQWPLYVAALWLFTRSNLAHGEPWRRTWDFVAIWAVGVGFVAVAVTVPGGMRWLLARPRLVRLGTISYGLYMFHEIAIWLTERISYLVGWFPFQETILPLVALGLTVALAWLSYTRFETPFLRLKARWTRVASRPIGTVFNIKPS